MVFDKDFSFLTEFGNRGLRPENLIIPDDLAIDKRDRLYVTQARRRGVSVFALRVADRQRAPSARPFRRESPVPIAGGGYSRRRTQWSAVRGTHYSDGN